MTDDIPDLFTRLGTLEVPRHLDPDSIRARGHKRLVRRRLLTGAGTVGTAAALTAGVVTLSGALLADPDRGAPQVAGDGTPVAPKMMPSTKPSGTPSPPSMSPGPPRDFPLALWSDGWDRKLIARGVPDTPGRSGGYDLKRGSVDEYKPVVRGKTAGYVAFLGTTEPAAIAAAKRNPCAIRWFPKDGVGAECHRQGAYWVKTYRDSNQGRTVFVRVVTDRADVLLAQSVGFPSYQQAISDSRNLLPYSGRHPLDELASSRSKPAPPLTQLPLPAETLADIAQELANSAPRS